MELSRPKIKKFLILSGLSPQSFSFLHFFPKNTRSKKISYIFLKKAFPIFWEMKLSYISGNGTF